MSDDDDLRKQFEEAIAGAELDDLRRLMPVLIPGSTEYVPRPELRKTPRREPLQYRITAELNGSQPRIWRTIEMRSDLGLDLVHQVLQGAFNWTDSHLFRFAIGGKPFGQDSQLFITPTEFEEGEVEGIPVEEVRLDQTMHEPGDVLHYVYDYGDNWDLTLRLDAVSPVDPRMSVARCVDGQRAAPPENCGGLRTEQDLSEVLMDPGHLDLQAVNAHLLDPLLLIQQGGVDAGLVKVLQRLRFTPLAGQLDAMALELLEGGERLNVDEFDAALRPVVWFLDRASGDGIALTSAGYLKPEDVEAAAEVVPEAKEWIGKRNREVQTVPILRFRQMLQTLGLLRKSKGRLLITKAGARGVVDHGFLWGHIASRLIAKEPRYNKEATLVMLLLCAGAPNGEFPEGLLVNTISALGWGRTDGKPLDYSDVTSPLLVAEVMDNLGLLVTHWRQPTRVTSVGRALAREALFWNQ